MAREICDMNGFDLVGKVCLKYGEEKTFTFNMLENQIYSHFNKTDYYYCAFQYRKKLKQIDECDR